jgi:hypothetical protein
MRLSREHLLGEAGWHVAGAKADQWDGELSYDEEADGENRHLWRPTPFAHFRTVELPAQRLWRIRIRCLRVMV